jgi:voltage-gated potassium channel
MFTALRSMFRDPEGKVILIWAVAQISIGTVAFSLFEGWSLVDSLYFSVVTLATVGFGDLHPTGTGAKLFTVVYILFGLGIIAAFFSELTKHRTALLARLVSSAVAATPNSESTLRPSAPSESTARHPDEPDER